MERAGQGAGGAGEDGSLERGKRPRVLGVPIPSFREARDLYIALLALAAVAAHLVLRYVFAAIPSASWR